MNEQETEAKRIFDATPPFRFSNGEPIDLPISSWSDKSLSHFMELAKLSLNRKYDATA